MWLGTQIAYLSIDLPYLALFGNCVHEKICSNIIHIWYKNCRILRNTVFGILIFFHLKNTKIKMYIYIYQCVRFLVCFLVRFMSVFPAFGCSRVCFRIWASLFVRPCYCPYTWVSLFLCLLVSVHGSTWASLSVCLSLCLSVCLSVFPCLWSYMSFFVCLPACLRFDYFVSPCLCLFVYPCLCLLVYLLMSELLRLSDCICGLSELLCLSAVSELLICLPVFVPEFIYLSVSVSEFIY